MSRDWDGLPCLITGGAGFGGAHLGAELLQRGARVYVFDQILPRTSYLVLAGLESKIEFIPGDVCDLQWLKRVLQRYEIRIVFHLAAQPIVPISNRLPYETAAINVMGTYGVLEAVRHSPFTRRLIFASSGAYYGTTDDGERPISEEQAPLKFHNLYAASKAAADVAVRAYARVYNLQAALCRFMNTYGPGDLHFSRIVPRAIHLLIRGERYDFGDRDDGTTQLDFLHVQDMARAYIALAEKLEAVSGEAFNVGTGRPTTTRDLALIISRLYDGQTREPLFRGPPKPRRVSKYLDIRKARELLGWTPTVELENGLGETIQWYRRHWAQLAEIVP